MKKFMSLLMGFVVLTGSTIGFANQTIVAAKVVRPPVIDGIGSDSLWAQAGEYAIYDSVEKVNMTVKPLYTDSEIFFLVSYPDPDQSNTHKAGFGIGPQRCINQDPIAKIRSSSNGIWNPTMWICL